MHKAIAVILFKLEGQTILRLVDDVGIFLRQRFAHLGTGIFGGGQPADLDQPVERDLMPLVTLR